MCVCVCALPFTRFQNVGLRKSGQGYSKLSLCNIYLCPRKLFHVTVDTRSGPSRVLALLGLAEDDEGGGGRGDNYDYSHDQVRERKTYGGKQHYK